MSVQFGGTIGTTYRDSQAWWQEQAQATGKSNVVFIVLDDLGFGSLGCYGSEISTPAMDAIAADGTQLTNFHATALCSPTRASLLTGRNHHAVGMAYLSHVDDGFPGYRGRIGHDSATLAEMLVDQGYNTMAVGKWHLTPMDQTTASGPYDQWPLARGFERYYGFLEGLTDQFHPELYYDNHPVPPPATPEEGYHLTTDLVDKSIEFIRDQTSITPEKPFFLYFALGATHTPFQAPREFVERYRGAYEEGWDVIRERRYQRQLETGVIPEGTELPPRNDDVQPWDDIAPDAQKAYARFQEVFAGFLEHTDFEIGRLMAGIEEIGRLDDTLVVLLADNGASQEGGPHGVLNTTQYENGHFPDLEEVIAKMDLIDGSSTQVNYPLGWAQAGNTPLRRYKQNTHAGGIRTSALIRLPQGADSIPRGVKLERFQHVTDIVPTVLEHLELVAPTVRRGLSQRPIDGRSLLQALEGGGTESETRAQYFETLGHRAIWKDGWKAVAFHVRGADFETDRWELYNLAEDFSETHDLAEVHPERLRALIEDWWEQARNNAVLPLDDRGFAQRANAKFSPHSPRDRKRFAYLKGVQHIGNGAAPPVPGRSFEVSTTVERPTGTEEGVLLAHGSWNSGYALLIRDGHFEYDFNYYGDHKILRSNVPVPAGTSRLRMRFVIDEHGTGGTASLYIDDIESGVLRLEEAFEYFVSFQGLDIGADRLSPVRLNGQGEFAFEGGFDEVVVELLDS
ncbi:arylsulfatase [Microbacterium sp. A84]|uniref:arylsulfatase n=1 Tax=Microbacterium sp. A84 TaxID=3450715 RepID=UPI003F43458E